MDNLIATYRYLLIGVFLSCMTAVATAQSEANSTWTNYGSDPGGTRYSTAHQIDRTNVSRLQLAWTYHTGAMQQETNLKRKAAFEATPILVRQQIVSKYSLQPRHRSRSAKRLQAWEYDAQVNLARNYSEVTSRGVSVWRDRKTKSHQPCRLRIFLGTIDGRIIALDGDTGKPCLDFGSKGELDLTQDVALAKEWRGGYEVTSAPAVYKDLVIVGSSIADNWKVDTNVAWCVLMMSERANCVGRGTPPHGLRLRNPVLAELTRGQLSR